MSSIKTRDIAAEGVLKFNAIKTNDAVANLQSSELMINHPGSVASTDLYDSSINSLVFTDKELNYEACNQTTANSTAINSAMAFNISPDAFLGSTYLVLRLPAIPAQVFVPRGWVFQWIQRISYKFAGMASADVTLAGHTNFAFNMACCENEEKRSKVILLAGQEITTATAAGSYGFIKLLLPFNDMKGLARNKPIDSDMLSNKQITVTVTPHESLRGWMTGNAVEAVPAHFESASLYSTRITIAEQTLGAFMNVNPGLFHSMPIQWPQSEDLSVIVSGVNGSFNLVSFQSGQLTDLIFFLVDDEFLSSSLANRNERVNRINTADISDIEVSFAGQTMFKSPGTLYKLISASRGIGSGGFGSSRMTVAAIEDFVTEPFEGNVVHIPMTNLNRFLHGNTITNCHAFTGSNFKITCTLPYNAAYTAFVTYVYNGMMRWRQGTVSLLS